MVFPNTAVSCEVDVVESCIHYIIGVYISGVRLVFFNKLFLLRLKQL